MVRGVIRLLVTLQYSSGWVIKLNWMCKMVGIKWLKSEGEVIKLNWMGLEAITSFTGVA